MKNYSFNESLAKEKNTRKWFDSIYESYGGKVKSICDYDTFEGKLQQQNDIDVLLEKDNKIFKVSEKARDKDFGDVYLEHYSVFEDKKIGWTQDSQADILAYGIPSKNICKIYEMAEVKNIYRLITSLLPLDEIENDMISRNENKRKIPVNIDTQSFNVYIIVAATIHNGKYYHTTGFTVEDNILTPIKIIKRED